MSKLKNEKFHFELLTRWLNFYLSFSSYYFELHFEWNLLFFNFELVARNENFIFQLWVDNSKVEK